MKTMSEQNTIVRTGPFVKLSSIQAAAIERALEINKNDEAKIIKIRISPLDEFFDELAPLNELSLDTLIRALYIGYGIVLSTDEKLKRLLNKERQSRPYVAEAIEEALDIIGYKIPR